MRNRQALYEVFHPGLPHTLIELIGVMDADLMKGEWTIGTLDPRETLDELRTVLVHLGMRNGKDDADLLAQSRDAAATAVEMAIASVAIGLLPSNSDTIRFIFGTIEAHRAKLKQDKQPDPAPYFVDFFQLMVLAAKPTQRGDIFEVVAKLTGLMPLK